MSKRVLRRDEERCGGPKKPCSNETMIISRFSGRFIALAFSGFFAFLPCHRAWPHTLLRQDSYTSFSREVLVHEVRSKFSHIRIRDWGSRRTLYFVRDTGEEVVETSMDLNAPHLLQIAYTRVMFVSFLLKERQERGLLVGLGGGAMVRFLNHFFPDVRLDAVEIDPAIVKVARDYFGTRPGPRTRIITEDAFTYFKRTTHRYDVIYMDAFLKPSESTDSTGVPLRLKRVAFLKSLHARLKGEGLVVFNLNENIETPTDIQNIREAFPSVYVFRVPGSGNLVVVGSLARKKVTNDELRNRALRLDRLNDYGFSFLNFANYRIDS